jgi:hypothetical protein
MSLPQVKNWPRIAAFVYAIFGLVIFSLSTIKPWLDNGEENFTFKRIILRSYVCAGYQSCPFDINIPFKTADQVMSHTPLSEYVNESLTRGHLKGAPETSIMRFFFTKRFSPIMPYY